MLKRKQNSANADWVKAWAGIESAPAFAEVDALAESTAERIRKAMLAPGASRVAFAWSGGKDSLVLESLCREAGVSKSVFVTDRALDYPEFLSWVEKHRPEGCECIDVGLGWDFLLRHPELLFPTAKVLPKWYALVQHRGQKSFYRKNGLDAMFFGRRKADGNMVRGSEEDCFAMNATDGRKVLCPIADWSHEHVLAFLKKRRIPMPPIYGWPDGWRQGTHLSPCRLSLGSEEANWKELWSFAPDVVKEAAGHLAGAQKFIETL